MKVLKRKKTKISACIVLLMVFLISIIILLGTIIEIPKFTGQSISDNDHGLKEANFDQKNQHNDQQSNTSRTSQKDNSKQYDMTNYDSFIDLNFRRSTNFSNRTFSGDVLFEAAKFYNDASFKSVKFLGLWTSFQLVRFKAMADFNNASFNTTALFFGATFNGEANFSSSEFFNIVDFEDSHFGGKTYFINTRFDNMVDFSKATFRDETFFFSANFQDYANFTNTQFHSSTIFDETTFCSSVSFDYSEFYDKISLDKTTFNDTLSLQRVQFDKGVDFRYAQLESVEVFFLDGMSYPEGQLFVEWEKIKTKDQPKIQLFEFPPKDNYKHFKRLEIIYLQLRDNYLKQGNTVSADQVMYELRFREEQLVNPGLKIYRITLGYGYKPFRLLFWGLLFIFIFYSFIWYFKYYGIIAFIQSKDSSIEIRQDVSTNPSLMMLRKFDAQGLRAIPREITLLTRFAHSLLFSASVLLSIRFKKEWLDIRIASTKKYRDYVIWLCSEYILGILLIFVFVYFLQENRFSLIRGFFGF